jgi:UDP-N-acetylmuramoyl-L-alanyl-D-glutamate--2,6-diaminopimelate ligase
MVLRSLSDLFASQPAIRSGLPDIPVSSICDDSRKVHPGSLFVACKGDTADGHSFISDAIHRGAVAVVGERSPQALNINLERTIYIPVLNSRKALAELAAAFYGFPAHKLTVIGVTGTDGKTTTTNLIYQILVAAGIPTGMISTVSAVIGDRVQETGFHVTTPSSLEVQQYLSEMVQAGLTHAVIETTSHGLVQHRVDACEFDVAVITNITHEHLDYHGSYEGYRAAKARLFEMLAETPSKPHGNLRLAVLNRSDGSYPYLQASVSSLSDVRLVTYGMQPGGDIWPEGIVQGETGLSFEAVSQDVRIAFQSSLLGRYNISNILAAVLISIRGLNLPAAAVAEGVKALPGIPGRMERIDLGQEFLAYVDFAHTPNALKQTLETAREMIQSGRVIAVFGAAGLRDRQKRKMMAATSVQLADLTILTAEDPRTEALDDILDEMADGARSQGAQEKAQFWRIPDRREAIRFALQSARVGDIVLACGKGHEQSMCYGVIEYPWDDRTALRAALSEMLGLPGPEMPFLPG